MSTANWIVWAVTMVVIFGVVLPLYIRRQDRLWREHRKEQRRLDWERYSR